MMKTELSRTCWKPERLKEVGVFLAFKSALLLPGVMEGKINLHLREALIRLTVLNCSDQESWRRPCVQQSICTLPSSPVRMRLTASACSSVRQMREREIMQHPPWEEFELWCPWLCGASILHVKSPEAMSSGSNVMLKSGFALSCKICQRFCLKGTDLQEDAWSACLIREKRQYFPLFFLFFWRTLACVCRILHEY